MRWNETTASKCRYGDVAGRIFGDAEIIWECSEDDYSGFAAVLAHMPDSAYVFYSWSYGSCSGCDEWDRADLSEDDIERRMRHGIASLKDGKTALAFLRGPNWCEAIREIEDADYSFASKTPSRNRAIAALQQYLKHRADAGSNQEPHCGE